MSLEVCAGCSTAYAVGLPACPQCGSTEVAGEGAAPMLPQMKVACLTEGCRAQGRVSTVRLPSVGINLVQIPQIACTLCGALVATVAGWSLGAEESNTMPKITKHGGPTNALADPPARIVGEHGPEVVDPPEPEEESSPGSSSRTSSAKEPTSPETKPAAPRKRAQTTGSPSRKARTGSSTASGTGGGQAAGTSEKT
ncbi:MAG: hypothetical protein ACRDQ0_05690 [Pseudonocardia sp.]